MPERRKARKGVGAPYMLIASVSAYISRGAKKLINFVKRVVGRIYTAIRNALMAIYKNRGQIAWFLFGIAFITTLLAVLNDFIHFEEHSKEFHQWLVSGHHWEMLIVGVSLFVLVAWNSISPSLRTLFANKWSRICMWGILGGLLVFLPAWGTWPGQGIDHRFKELGMATLYIVGLGILAKIRPPKKITTPELPYIEDNPRLQSDDVRLYKSQVQITKDIQNLIGGAQPSTLAISGRWGIGKTFLLEHAKRNLSSDGNIIWVDFEPWRYASEEALIRGFYEDIGKKLAAEIPGAQNIVRPLVDTTEKFVKKSDGSGFIGAAIDTVRSIFKNSDSENPESQIQGLLEREGKRLVIIIDDVERSFNAERIFRTLQLAHFAKRIRGAQVIFLCDKDVILKARPPHFGDPSQDAAEYIEKFVEREVVIPSPRSAELRQLFSQLMDAQNDKPGFSFNDNDLPDDILAAIGTPRAILRLFNEYAAYRINVEGSE